MGRLNMRGRCGWLGRGFIRHQMSICGLKTEKKQKQ
jgi:hypothetical protein